MKKIEIIKKDEKDISRQDLVNLMLLLLNHLPLLHIAVMADNLELVQQIIKSGVNVDELDDDGCTALFYCESIPIAKELIEAGANPNILDIDGFTAVTSMGSPHEDVQRYLIGVSNIDLCGPNAHTLLDKLILYGVADYELISILLHLTTNKNKLLEGETLLFHAAKRKINKNMILFLAKYPGMDLHFRNKAGKDFYEYCSKDVQKEISKQMPEFMKER